MKFTRKGESNYIIQSNVLSEFEFKKASVLGAMELFQFETQYGGFRFLHLYDKEQQATYCIQYFPHLDEEPYCFSLELEDFHILTSYWLVALQIFGQQSQEEENQPLEDIILNVSQMMAKHDIQLVERR
ncbi:hypothetical protein CN918_28755 [Priestia megaterium]|nr:hypothetical protein CN918_28755 [Priestia megaterium]